MWPSRPIRTTGLSDSSPVRRTPGRCSCTCGSNPAPLNTTWRPSPSPPASGCADPGCGPAPPRIVAPIVLYRSPRPERIGRNARFRIDNGATKHPPARVQKRYPRTGSRRRLRQAEASMPLACGKRRSTICPMRIDTDRDFSSRRGPVQREKRRRHSMISRLSRDIIRSGRPCTPPRSDGRAGSLQLLPRTGSPMRMR